MKDIFIDNNIAKNFSNPLDEHYKRLVDWLLTTNKGAKEDNAHLVLSHYLLREYKASNRQYENRTNILSLISILRKEDRVNFIESLAIQQFQKENYTANTFKSLKVPPKKRASALYNLVKWNKDLNHIPAVLLSVRKMAVTYDAWFSYALNNFPGYRNQVTVRSRPEDLNYR